jgi:hypothetical protein
MRISRSEKPITLSGMTPEHRNHMLRAVWSSSLSEDSCQARKEMWQMTSQMQENNMKHT